MANPRTRPNGSNGKHGPTVREVLISQTLAPIAAKPVNGALPSVADLVGNAATGEPMRAEWVIIRPRQAPHAVHRLRVSAISVISENVKTLDGPFMVRCDGQVFSLTETDYNAVCQAAGV